MRISFFDKEKFTDPENIKKLHTIASFLVLALMAALFVYFFWPLAQPKADFYNELWGPAYLMLHGQSPYNTASLDPVLPAAWFPMAIGFFSPLGWLSENIALLVWFLICTLELFIIVSLSQGSSRAVHVTLIAALLAFSFPPTLYHFFLGQITLTVALCMILAAQSITKGNHWLAAFLIALGLSKPHLGILAVVGMSIHYLKQGGARTMITFYLRIASMIILLCLPLFFAYPDWIPDAIASMRSNSYWVYPSLFVLLQRNAGAFGVFIWGLVVVSALSLIYFLWKKLPPVNAMFWSLGLALLVTPYLGSWDFVLLLPILISAFSQANWKRKLFLVLSYLLAWYGMALIQSMEPSHNYYFWWVPPWFLASVAIVTHWKEYMNRQIKTS